MQIYVQAFQQAVQLLASGDPTTAGIILLSLRVSGAAVLIATLIGLPIGYALGTSRFMGRGVLMVFVNTAMGFPPVVIGLFVWMALSRSGPLGGLDLLFTPEGMVIAQVILSTPLVVGVSAAAVANVSRDLRLQLRALGASRIQEGLAVFKEVRSGVLAAIVAGFGSIISEVGAVSIVGGGIEGHTNVMTTAIMADVRRGDLAAASAMGLILIAITFTVNIVLTLIQNTGAGYER